VPDIVPLHTRLAPSSSTAIAKVRKLTEVLQQLPQTPFVTEHMLHAGLYTRTVRLPADTVATAVLIQVPTVLIVAGDARLFNDDDVIECSGFSVLPGSAGRKVALTTSTDVVFSMIFPTKAKTVDEAQKEFTPEHELLVPLSRVDEHLILITGE